ncbi:MAG: hypothetical protein ABWZ56_02435 [Flavobacterium sp.]
MKKSTITFFALLAFTSLTFLISCKNNEEKIDDAQEDVLNAKKDLIEAEQDSLADYEAFKMKIDKKITDNELKIADLKVKVIDGNANEKAKYNEKVVQLEEKNRALETKLNNYSEYTAETWAAFKTDLDYKINELEVEFDEFNAKK